MDPLTDISPMPFGMYKGKPMQDVPVSYLHYLWTSNIRDAAPSSQQYAVAQYIEKNLNALKMEDKDKIW